MGERNDGTAVENCPDRIVVVREDSETGETDVVGKDQKSVSVTENKLYSVARHFAARKAMSNDETGADADGNGPALMATEPDINASNSHQSNSVAYNAPKQGPWTSSFKTRLFSKNEKVRIIIFISIDITQGKILSSILAITFIYISFR